MTGRAANREDPTEGGVVPVAIVGAGPTGVTAALLLAGYGVRCLLLDRWAGVYPQPRAVHLDDEVCRILGRIAVAGDFAGISRPGLGLRLVDRDLHLLAEFRRSGSTGRHGYPEANMFDQPDLERLLRQALTRRPEVTLRADSVVTALSQRADHVQVDVADRGGGPALTLRARYVLGCDGANSLVRAEIGSQLKDLGFEQRWLVIDVESPVELRQWEGVHQVCDPRRAATYMRIGATRYRWEFRMLPGESVADYSSLAAVRELIRPWTPQVPYQELQLIRASEYTFRARVADRWRDRRVFLLGDAAHLTPPFIGQGLGAGLRDAANLAWKLAGVLQGGLDDGCLDTYQTERKSHATAMIRLAVILGRAMTGGGRSGEAIRRLVAPRLRLVPGLRARVLDSATPRLSRSSLAERSWRHLPLRGALCPNAELDGATRLDDVSAGFLLLVLAGPGTGVDGVTRGQVEAAGGAVVPVGPDTGLGRWLRRGWARAAVVRPDGTVFAAGRRAGDLLPRLPGFPLPATVPTPRPPAAALPPDQFPPAPLPTESA